MTPYYDQNDVAIYNADVREAPSVVPEKWADLISADPPYGETSLSWDRWPKGWVSAVGPLAKSTGSMWCFGSLRMFLARRDDFAFWKLSHEVVWEKHNGSGFLTDRFRRVHELAAHFYPCGVPWSDVYKSPVFTMDATARTVRMKEKPKHWHGKIGATTFVSQDGGPRMMRSVIRVRSCHSYALNETQKPEGIVTPLIEYGCPVGGNLLVPFCGSGTDLIVARALGIKAIAFEVREEQCEASAKRLAQGDLFAPPGRSGVGNG